MGKIYKIIQLEKEIDELQEFLQAKHMEYRERYSDAPNQRMVNYWCGKLSGVEVALEKIANIKGKRGF